MKAVLSANTKYVNSFSTDPAPNSLDHQAISYFGLFYFSN
jgi:hypothetical protein